MTKKNLTKDIKLLYVEDNDELREETLEILEYYFQNIIVAKNGEEGLELYKREFELKTYFDIVVSDIEMPKMDGVLMCKKIKEIKKDQIVVLLSAYDTKEYLKEAINLGVNNFIVKPVVDACDFISLLEDLSQKALLELEYKEKDFILKQKNKIIDENVFMIISDLDGNIIEISKAYLDFTGFTKEEIIGENHFVYRYKNANEEVIKNLWETIKKDKVWIGELKNKKFTKEDYWIKANISPLYNVNNVKIGYTAIVQDITNAKRLEVLTIRDEVAEIENKNQFTKQAKNLDVKIELPNREALIKDLSLLQEDAMLILLHINQINSIKELYGMQAVSEIVLQKAKELEQVVIDNSVTLYCLNMQEFAMLIKSKTLFEKYMELLKYSVLINSDEDSCCTGSENSLISEFSAGVSYGMTDIFNQAEIALQDAIIMKKNLSVYDNNQSNIEFQKDKLSRLKIYKKALNDGNIVPYFQPIIDVRDNSVMKYEALARLVLDNGEVVSPCHFLDSSKQDNTFEFFSRQIIQKVFNIYDKKKADISINIAYENINSQTMRDYIKNRLDKYGGDGITFEILESEDIEDYALIDEFIKMVKKYNCKISIDDFGSGYSNFTNIINLDIDYIKLDGSLIEKINIDKNVEHMVVALLDFVKNTKIKTIAEFVSTKELDAKVRELGIDYIQGYLYGEPNTAESYGLV